MDPFNPATRKYVFEQMKRNYMAYGIKTFWLDEAEPERHTQDINTRYGYHDGTDAQVGLAWSRAEQQMVWYVPFTLPPFGMMYEKLSRLAVAGRDCMTQGLVTTISSCFRVPSSSAERGMVLAHGVETSNRHLTNYIAKYASAKMLRCLEYTGVS
jgi:hypothetical protein